MKKLLGMLVTLALSLVVVSAVGAQDQQSEGERRGPVQTVIAIVAEEIGLDEASIISLLHEGNTVADIIMAQGGDVQQVIDVSIARLTEQINLAVAEGRITQQRADRLLTNLPSVVTDGINGDLLPNRLDQRRLNRHGQGVLIQAVADATGLRPAAILQQMAQGATLAEIITSNGENVDVVVATAVADASQQINTALANGRIGQEQADELLAGLEAFFTDLVNGEYRERATEVRIGMAVIRLAAEQTGLSAPEIVQALRDGQTLGTILAENGVDPAAFVEDAVAVMQERLDAAVANGRLSSDEATDRLTRFREWLTTSLDQGMEG